MPLTGSGGIGDVPRNTSGVGSCLLVGVLALPIFLRSEADPLQGPSALATDPLLGVAVGFAVLLFDAAARAVLGYKPEEAAHYLWPVSSPRAGSS